MDLHRNRRRDETAPSFLVETQDLAGRLVNRVQLTTDGHKMYLSAVEETIGGASD
jgi:hypothetical protein